MSDEVKYSLVFKHMPIACLLVDISFEIVAASQKFYELAMSDESILGKNIFEPFPMNEYTKLSKPELAHQKSLEYVLEHKQSHRIPVQRYDLKLDDKNGSDHYISKWWQVDNHPILDDDGEVIYILKIIEDITSLVDNLLDADEAIAGSERKDS